MRRPYIGAPRPVIPEPFVGPSNDGVGMNDSGRGMASPLLSLERVWTKHGVVSAIHEQNSSRNVGGLVA